MKKSLLIVFVLVSFIFISFATVFKNGQDIVIASDELIEDNVFIVAEKLRVEGTIKGDLIAISPEIEIRGIVEGDVMLAGSKVIIKPKKVLDVRVLASEVYLDTNILGDLFVMSAIIEFAKDNKVAKDVNIYAAHIKLNGLMSQNANLRANKIDILRDTLIQGNLEASIAEKDIKKHQDAKVLGNTSFNQSKLDSDSLKKTLLGFFIIGEIFSFLSYFLFAMVLVILFPNYIKQVNVLLTENTFQCLGIGAFFFFMIPIIIFILFLSILGIPIALIMSFGFLLTIYSVKVFISIWLGYLFIRHFFKKEDPSLIASLLLGSIFYYVIFKFIIFIGWFLWLISVFLGIGALTISKKNAIKVMRKNKVI